MSLSAPESCGLVAPARRQCYLRLERTAKTPSLPSHPPNLLIGHPTAGILYLIRAPSFWGPPQLPRLPRQRKAADRLLEYVASLREMIRYPEFRERGWQIGSGPTEAQCKLTVGRLKGRSRRWDRPNAAAVTALDSLERSGQWHIYFPNPSTAAA